MCSLSELLLHVLLAWTFSVVWSGSSFSGQFSPSLPSLFPLFIQCDGCLFSLSWVGAHGWIARICQPWEKSPSRSWLPVVIAPGCLRHPTSTWWCSWLQHAPQSFSNWWSQQYVVGLLNMNLINIQTYNKFSISQCNSSALQNVKIWVLMPFWGLKFSLCPMLATDWWMTFFIHC